MRSNLHGPFVLEHRYPRILPAGIRLPATDLPPGADPGCFAIITAYPYSPSVRTRKF
jgi:hypothetical protein